MTNRLLISGVNNIPASSLIARQCQSKSRRKLATDYGVSHETARITIWLSVAYLAKKDYRPVSYCTHKHNIPGAAALHEFIVNGIVCRAENPKKRLEEY